MIKFLAASLPLCVEVVLYAVYGSEYSAQIFFGIPRALPRFRDLYILVLNIRCPTPVHLFSTVGSCSDRFYGLSPGQFDYPLLPFYIFSHIPQFFSDRPNLLGLLLGIAFIISFAAISAKLQEKYKLNQALALIVFILSIYSFPFRYLIERGQLDQLAWTLAFLSILLCANKEALSRNKLRFLVGLLLLSVSASVKAFTLPFLGITAIYLWLKTKSYFNAVASTIFFVITAAQLFANPTSPGSVASSLQIAQGTVFGFHSGLSALGPNQYCIRILFKISIIAFSFLINYLNLSSIPLPRLNMINLTESLGASTYLGFYFVTASANYKLIPIALISLWLIYSKISARSGSVKFTCRYFLLINIESIAPFFAFAWIGYYNYRPYIPSLEFLAVDFTDFVVFPYLAGLSVSILLILHFRLNSSRKVSAIAKFVEALGGSLNDPVDIHPKPQR